MSNIDPNNFLMEEPEDREFIVLPEGEYPFVILEINQMETSKSGNPMIPLKLEFTGPGGSTTVYEYLVFADKAAFKIKQFLKSIAVPIGQRVDFEDPQFLKWVKAQKGRAKLGVEPVQGKTYDRNKVEAFVYDKAATAAGGPPAAKAKVVPEDEVDDDIPF